MRLISWNINGANAAAKKGLINFMQSEQADVYCFQEVKVSEKTIQKELLAIPGYSQYFWNSSKVKKGHAGVITYIKDGVKSISDSSEIGNDDIDQQGRVIILEFENFFLANCYYTNAGRELINLDRQQVRRLRRYFFSIFKITVNFMCGFFSCFPKLIYHSMSCH